MADTLLYPHRHRPILAVRRSEHPANIQPDIHDGSSPLQIQMSSVSDVNIINSKLSSTPHIYRQTNKQNGYSDSNRANDTKRVKDSGKERTGKRPAQTRLSLSQLQHDMTRYIPVKGPQSPRKKGNGKEKTKPEKSSTGKRRSREYNKRAYAYTTHGKLNTEHTILNKERRAEIMSVHYSTSTDPTAPVSSAQNSSSSDPKV